MTRRWLTHNPLHRLRLTCFAKHQEFRMTKTCLSILLVLSAVPSLAQTSYQQIGNTIFSSDGTSYQSIGNTTFGSDGSSYQHK